MPRMHCFPADIRLLTKPSNFELGMVNSSFQERDGQFWEVERRNLISKFNQRVRERLAGGDNSHLSLFALAPQPLLILLETLPTDIPRADVYQFQREPAGWTWPDSASAARF